MKVESLRENRKGATVIFTQFALLKDKYADSIFCCFEGDDSKYYFHRIESETGYSPDNIIAFNCGGKKEVLRLYGMIKTKTEYSAIKFLYFIDKDFDAKTTNSEIFETNTYSIENLYTTEEAFTRVVRCELNYT